GVLLHPIRGYSTSNPGFFSNRRSTRAGCEGALACLPFRTEGGAPTPKPGFSYIKTGGPSRTVGAPAPGAKVLWLDTLSHRGRCSYVQIGILLHPNRGSPSNCGGPRPGREGVLAGHPCRTGGGPPRPKPGFPHTNAGTLPEP